MPIDNNVSNVLTDRDPEFYKQLAASLDNNSVLRVKNEDGIFVPVSCSREFAEMMECSPEEFLEKERTAPLSTVFPEDRAAAEYLLENGRTPDGSTHAMIRKNTAKGNIIWVDMHYAFFEHGGKSYAYCNYFDITPLKESEQRSRAMYDELNLELQNLSNERLAAIRSNLADGIVEEISGCDLFDCDKVGESVSTLLQRRLESMPDPADRQRYLEHFNIESTLKSYQEGTEIEPLVIFSERQSGRKCFVKYSASMRKDPITGKSTVFGIETEYNTEKVNELLQQKILARQYDMISYIVDGSYSVVIGDSAAVSKGSIFPKQRSGRYMDYITEQVIPAAFTEVHDPKELLRALSPETVEAALAADESYTVDVACQIEGDIFYKRFTFYAVDPSLKFYILLKADFTEMQAEQAARNEQLKSALEEARQANVAKTTFLSNMSHEIRTPMNAIIGLDNIALSEEGISDRTREHLEQIGVSARHLLGLINDILDMSRIESGRMVLRSEEFSFSSMIEQINTMISGQCRDKGIEYDCVFSGRMEDYYIGDDTKLKQVLINILGNAVKFTPAGGRILLSAESVARFEDKSTLRFTVSDTGVGIDPDYLPRLFEAFTQEDIANTSRYGGSGLGLAITKNIVEMMNGAITVESEKHKGSVFTVTVTLGNSARTGKAASGSISPKDMDVLIIDDDPIACDHARLVLGEVGVASEAALSGREALELIRIRQARQAPYNLILVDLHMPEQNGIEVTRQIRALVGSETTVIILTAYNWDDVMDEALEAGVDSFLAKPLFSANALEQFSQAIMKKRNKAESSRAMAALEGRRILLAEDIEINARIMKHLLAMKQIETDIAANGEEALRLFLDNPVRCYDAILMDVRMPVMDGLDAAAAIRALDREDAKTIPIIAMTANAFDEDVQRSLQAGMDAHLSKPVEPELLFETLASLIKD
ncbi:MAG: response regulator [Ruminococcus sp.]|nr:response regulator [Ruminococcus sp.]